MLRGEKAREKEEKGLMPILSVTIYEAVPLSITSFVSSQTRVHTCYMLYKALKTKYNHLATWDSD